MCSIRPSFFSTFLLWKHRHSRMFRPVFLSPLYESIVVPSTFFSFFSVQSSGKVFYVPIDFSMSFALFLTCFFCFFYFQGRYAERRTISRRKCWVVKDTDMKPISGQWVALCKFHIILVHKFWSVFLYRKSITSGTPCWLDSRHLRHRH